MRRISLAGSLLYLFAASLGAIAQTPEQPLRLRYAHMNPAGSPSGLQAQYFADRIAERTRGAVLISVFPDSALGSIAEMAAQVSAGKVAMHHTTYGGLQPLLEDLGLFDTPFLYRDVDHLLAATDPERSPVLKELNERLIAAREVRILYSFYFGTRQLTANAPAYAPADLVGKKIRAIPSPIYETAVEGMGADAVPVDWKDVPAALAAGLVDGQENPVSTILTSKLYSIQKYLMLTRHIMGSEPVVINENVWRALSAEHKAIFRDVAEETRGWISAYIRDNEERDLQTLKRKGMVVIGAEEGLRADAFRSTMEAVVEMRFGAKWGRYYRLIRAME